MYDSGTSRGHSNNLGRVKIDRRGILTVKSILDERANSYDDILRDRRPQVNQGRFGGVERRRSSNTYNMALNTFRSKIICLNIYIYIFNIVLNS